MWSDNSQPLPYIDRKGAPAIPTATLREFGVPLSHLEAVRKQRRFPIRRASKLAREQSSRHVVAIRNNQTWKFLDITGHFRIEADAWPAISWDRDGVAG